MKKTLALLTAVAFCAAPAFSATLADYEFSVTTGGNFYAGDFTFDFCITTDVYDTLSTTDVLLAAYYGNGTSGNPDANAYHIAKTEDGQITITAGRGHFSSVGSTLGTWSQYGSDKQSITLTLETDTIYTISNIGGNQAQSFSILEGSTELAKTTGAYNGNMNGGNAASDMKEYFNQTFNPGLANIPEPATASLSLLGLASLMMRRRRA